MCGETFKNLNNQDNKVYKQVLPIFRLIIFLFTIRLLNSSRQVKKNNNVEKSEDALGCKNYKQAKLLKSKV